MTTRNEQLHVTLEEIFEEDAERARPLSEEEIGRLRSGNLDEEMRQALIERLIFDKDAVAAVVGEPEVEPAEVSEGETEASWQRFARRLEQKNSPYRRLIEPDRRPRAFPWIEGLAAALFLTTAVLAFQLARLDNRMNELIEPIIGIPSELIYLGGPETRGPVPEIVMKGRVRVYHLRLHPSLGNHPRWQVSIFDLDGTTLKTEMIEADETRTIELRLTRDFFDRAGIYRIRVTGKGGDGREPVVELDVDIEEI